MPKEKNALTWLWVTVLVIIIDQVTKYLVNQFLTFNQIVHVLPFLNITLRYNAGAAFGFLGLGEWWQILFLGCLSIFISIGIIIWLSRVKADDRLQAFALSLILGGALGNLIDRLRVSLVTDFIDFHVRNWHYATFNIADSAICIGAALLIWRMMFMKKQEERI